MTRGIGNPFLISVMLRITSGLGDLARGEIPTGVGGNSSVRLTYCARSHAGCGNGP
jgi:hypothetical protein